MKKIIFVFGLPGAGKNDFINDIINNTNNIRETFNISNALKVCDDIRLHGSSIDTFADRTNRYVAIKEDIDELLESDDEVLLIFGHMHDLEESENAIIKRIVANYPCLEKDIYLLDIPDHNLLYERLVNTDWFKSDIKNNQERFPKAWLDVADNHLRKQVEKQKEYGFNVIEVDATDGFVIREENIKTK